MRLLSQRLQLHRLAWAPKTQRKSVCLDLWTVLTGEAMPAPAAERARILHRRQHPWLTARSAATQVVWIGRNLWLRRVLTQKYCSSKLGLHSTIQDRIMMAYFRQYADLLVPLFLSNTTLIGLSEADQRSQGSSVRSRVTAGSQSRDRRPRVMKGGSPALHCSPRRAPPAAHEVRGCKRRRCWVGRA